MTALDRLVSFAGPVFRTLLRPLEGIDPFIGIAVFSAVAGVLILLLFRALSDPARIRRARSRVVAHLLEMRLYGDEPMVVLRAQRGLLFSNIRYLALVLKPAVLLVLGFTLMYPSLDNLYGRRPLRPGQETLLTIGVEEAGRVPGLALAGPVEVTSPAVRSVHDREISWRIRGTAPGTARASFKDGAGTPVVVGDGPRNLISDVLPASGAIRSIHVDYPATTIRGLTLDLPWEVWFLVLSSVTALALRRWFGVQF